MIMERRSRPIITLSLAISKQSMVTLVSPVLAAWSAASLHRLARSAPVKPGVPFASTSRLTSSASGIFRVWTPRIFSRPFTSGLGTTTCRSNRPGRISAGSRTSGRFVAAMRISPSFDSKPSISTRSWFSVCSRSSSAPPSPAVSPDRVDLVDEDDAGGGFLPLDEQVAHPRRPDADEHLHEVGPADGEERHARLAGDRPGQQRLAGAGGADEEHPLRDAAAELGEPLG